MRQKFIYPTIVAILSVLLLVSHFRVPALAQPGTASDPLVTQRYVDERITKLEAQITALQDHGNAPPLNGGQASLSQAQRDAIISDITNAVNAGQVVPFSAIFVPQGSVIIADAGAEIILRTGAANVVAGSNGLVDATAGTDVGNGQPVRRNHLMLVPATDGRGLHFTADSWLMIKGGYVIG